MINPTVAPNPETVLMDILRTYEGYEAAADKWARAKRSGATISASH